MNLGIYLPSLSDQDLMKDISESINYGLDNGLLMDASVFFDDVSYNSHNVKCGVFNSTELWNFNGVLVTTALSTTLSAFKIVNNIQLYYYYGLEDRVSPLSLIYLLKEPLQIICDCEESKHDVYRKTGKRDTEIFKNFYDIINRIKLR
jgi:hypothetical protein